MMTWPGWLSDTSPASLLLKNRPRSSMCSANTSGREAVAEAVALMAGVAQSAPALASRSQPKRWLSPRLRRTVAVALASAACLALAVAPRLIELRARRNITDASRTTPGPGSAVALAWLNSFDEAAETPRPDDAVSAFDDPEADPMTPVETVADRGELVEDLPAWLIEAASLRPELLTRP